MNAYDPNNVFARILRDEIPSDRVYEDPEFIAFRDIDPKAKVHVLVIPRGERPYRLPPSRMPMPGGSGG